MLLDSEKFKINFQIACDHFSQNLEQPFDFPKVAFRSHRIPLDFASNILKLAVALNSQYKRPTTLFMELSRMVASCIALEIVRQNAIGMALHQLGPISLRY